MTVLAELSLSERHLQEFIQSLRKARYESLQAVAGTIFEDTWCRDGRLCYWPGGSFDYWFFEFSPREKRVIDRFCDDYSWELHGVGSGRIVMSPPERTDIVFKIGRYGFSSRFGEGPDANAIEVDRWMEIHDYPLLPIYEWSSEYSWIVVPYADPLSESKSSDKGLVCDNLYTEVENHPTIIPARDIRPANVGWFNGEWRLLDYGQPFRSNVNENNVLLDGL